MYSQATPRLLNLCVTGCDEFASNELCTSSTIVFFIYLVYLKTVEPTRERYCVLLIGDYACVTRFDELAGNELCLPGTSAWNFTYMYRFSVFLVRLEAI